MAEPATVASIHLLKRGDQAPERRRQLLRVAGELIEAEGVAGLTIPRVSERAGCTRTLVYRYFASREVLLMAVLSDFFEQLDQQMPEAEQRAAVTEFFEHPEDIDPQRAHALIEMAWDQLTAAGLGGAILRSTPQHSPPMQELIESSRARHESRFREPLCAAGLSTHEAEVAIDAMIASFVRLALKARAGTISRAEAIQLHTRATTGLIEGLFRSR